MRPGHRHQHRRVARLLRRLERRLAAGDGALEIARPALQVEQPQLSCARTSGRSAAGVAPISLQARDRRRRAPLPLVDLGEVDQQVDVDVVAGERDRFVHRRAARPRVAAGEQGAAELGEQLAAAGDLFVGNEAEAVRSQ